MGWVGLFTNSKLSIYLILSNLNNDFAQQSKETSILKLINLLKTIEPTLKKDAKTVMLVDSSASKKSSKNKKKTKKPMKAKGSVTKKDAQRGSTKRHLLPLWPRRSLEEEFQSLTGYLKKKASDAPSTLGMFVIEVNIVSHNNQWVLDTGCGSHICTNVRGLRNSRGLNKGESDL